MGKKITVGIAEEEKEKEMDAEAALEMQWAALNP